MAKNKKKKNNRIAKHLKKIGFTNRLAVYMLLFLFFGLVGGFYLGIKSIETEYMGSLMCWTVVFTPIGTATSIAISRVVDKSKAENTAGGIKYETALNGIIEPDDSYVEEPVEIIDEYNVDSPQI